MSQTPFGITPFSTRVELWLEGEFGRVTLAQTGPTFVIAASPRSLAPCKAVVVVSIDGKPFSRPVRLANGMSETDPRAMVLADDGLPF